MKYRIVVDSSANFAPEELILANPGSESFSPVDIKSVPLKIYCGTTEYVDAPGLDIKGMLDHFDESKERTSTSCPNVYDWEEAFRGADWVFAVTITSKLSGSYATAMQARSGLLLECPDQKICVIDSYGTGPAMQLIAEKLIELIEAGHSFEEIGEEIIAYRKRVHLRFCLKSLSNLARNGRVNPAVAKIAGMLGIRVIGEASPEGELHLQHKTRGEQKTVEKLVEEITGCGSITKVLISHCLNEPVAKALADAVRAKLPLAEIRIGLCGGLCSYYAERGGLIIGFV